MHDEPSLISDWLRHVEQVPVKHGYPSLKPSSLFVLKCGRAAETRKNPQCIARPKRLGKDGVLVTLTSVHDLS